MKLSDSLLSRFGEETIGSLPLEKSGTIEGFIETATDWIWQWSIDKRSRSNIASGYCAIALDPDLVAGKQPPEYVSCADFRGDRSRICQIKYRLRLLLEQGDVA